LSACIESFAQLNDRVDLIQIGAIHFAEHELFYEFASGKFTTSIPSSVRHSPMNQNQTVNVYSFRFCGP